MGPLLADIEYEVAKRLIISTFYAKVITVLLADHDQGQCPWRREDEYRTTMEGGGGRGGGVLLNRLI
jgi:hypothetical protein